MKNFVLAAAMLLAAGGAADAGELKIVTGAGMTGAVREMAAAFQKRTGTQVTVVGDTTGGVQKRLEGGESADLVLVTVPVMAALADKKLVQPEHTDIARVMVGVAVRKGAKEPDISSAEAVKAALLAAKSVSYVDPKMGGITGPFFVALCREMGIEDQVAAKAVLKKTGGEVAAAVAAGEAELGVTLVSELLPDPGITLAGPLPAGIQIDTVYTVALGGKPANAAAAKKMLAEMLSPDGLATIRQAGLMAIAQ